MRLVLASASPRRKELLTQAGFAFEVRVAGIDETRNEGEAPIDYVRRLAMEKAQAVLAADAGAVVLGADTTVVLHGEVMNKPRDRGDAERMLRALSGKTHQVHTGVALVCSQCVLAHVETTDVVFREMGSGRAGGLISIQAMRWTRLELTASKDLRLGGSRGSRATTSMWWGCRLRRW